MYNKDIIIDVCNLIKINNNELLNIYLYGSQVYECHNSKDIDLIIVRDSSIPYEQFFDEKYDITCYNIEEFEKSISNHEISVLECLFLPNDKKILERKVFDFVLDLQKLRSSISQQASNSFVKTKKKLTIEKDLNIYIGKKSLFHSLRILMFGIQIAIYGKIIDYKVANYFWKEIIENNNKDWNYFKEKFQPIYNQLSSEFKKVAPK